MNTFTIEPSPTSGGATISIDGQAVLTIEPIGTPEPGQHFIATPLVGPDAGRQTRIPPCPRGPLPAFRGPETVNQRQAADATFRPRITAPPIATTTWDKSSEIAQDVRVLFGTGPGRVLPDISPEAEQALAEMPARVQAAHDEQHRNEAAAYRAGRAAKVDGAGEDTCPHQGQRLRSWWLQGYRGQ